jgi:hypothetical protein
MWHSVAGRRRVASTSIATGAPSHILVWIPHAFPPRSLVSTRADARSAAALPGCLSIAIGSALGCSTRFPRAAPDDPVVRLISLWKPASVASVLLAATLYAGLVGHEISRRTQLAEERRARTEASQDLVDDEVMLGAIWAHRHHPYDDSWCPDYSPSFRKGCAAAASSFPRHSHDQ